MDLEAYPAPEIIFHKLVAYIKRGALIDLLKILSLVKSYGWKYFKGILFLDKCKFQMLSIIPYGAPYPLSTTFSDRKIGLRFSGPKG